MDMKPVKSANLKAVGYDPTTKTLAIEFSGGNVYHYSGVPPELHDDLCACESFGRFFQERIRGKYEYQKQEKKEAARGNQG